MSISVANVGDLPYRIVGNQKRTVTDVTLDNSYPTGGEAVTAAQLGLNRVEVAHTNIKTVTSATTNMASTYFDVTNMKLKVYDETPAEVTNTGDLTAAVIQVTAFGS